MASENIGSVYPTKIPGYEDAADIQAALRLYHYGTSNEITNNSQIIPDSVVGHIKALDTRIDSIETNGIGSAVLPSIPTGVDDGYIWVDSTTLVTSTPQYATASYQASQPENPTTGALWVDSDSSPYLKMYVWSGSEWKEIGA
jgi:hypothetical protein